MMENMRDSWRHVLKFLIAPKDKFAALCVCRGFRALLEPIPFPLVVNIPTKELPEHVGLSVHPCTIREVKRALAVKGYGEVKRLKLIAAGRVVLGEEMLPDVMKKCKGRNLVLLVMNPN